MRKKILLFPNLSFPKSTGIMDVKGDFLFIEGSEADETLPFDNSRLIKLDVEGAPQG